MTDPTDECARTLSGEALESEIASGPVGARHTHFDELVIVQGTRRLGDHAGSDAGIADEDHGLEWVRQTAKVAPLFFGKLHRRNCSGLHS